MSLAFPCLALRWILPAMLATPVEAAVVQQVNAAKTRALLKLSAVEMAQIPLDARTNVEISSRTFNLVTSGVLRSLDPVKKTVVLVLAQPEPGLAPRQQARFLSTFWNPVSAPLLFSLSQYHQYGLSSAHAGAGGFFETLTEKRPDREATATSTGSLMRVDGHLLLAPTWTGLTLGYGRRAATTEIETTTFPAAGDPQRAKTSGELVANTLAPGAWLELKPGRRLGLSFDYVMLETTEKTETSRHVYAHNLAQPSLGLTLYDASGEVTLLARLGDTATSVSTSRGATAAPERTVKAPGELLIQYRRATSGTIVLGYGLGYVFYERSLKGGEPLREKASLPEQLRARMSLEHRLDGGGKLDWVLLFDGGKTAALGRLERTVSTGGLALTYMTPAASQIAWGGTLTLEGGGRSHKEDGTDPQGQAVSLSNEQIGVGASLLLFAQLEADLVGRPGSRRQ